MDSEFTPKSKSAKTSVYLFSAQSDAAECKIYEIAGKTVNYSFQSTQQNILRLAFIDISH
jgi:hypothetical protein